MTKSLSNRICQEHTSSFQRVHGRVDILEKAMTKVNTSLFGDIEHGIEGLLQANAKFQERVNMWLRIWTFIGSTLTVAIISVAIKLFSGAK